MTITKLKFMKKLIIISLILICNNLYAQNNSSPEEFYAYFAKVFNEEKIDEVHWDSGLGKWLKEKWVDISRKDDSGKHPKCGASAKKGGRSKNQKKAYPKCRPESESLSMSSDEKKKAVSQKRNAEGKKKHKKGRKPIVVSHYKENISFKSYLERRCHEQE